jgi:glycosyltransferase involved in cell wall biosynthesis
MEELSSNRYNLLLCPLYDNEFTRGKSPIKLLEACCCGAVGLFSDMPVYNLIKDGENGFKIKYGESWFDKISSIIKMPKDQKKKIFKCALATVQDGYTTEAGLDRFRLAMETAQLASNLGGQKILFVSHSPYLGGAESLIFRHATLAKEAGLPVLFALPATAEGMQEELQDMLSDEGFEVLYLEYRNYCELEDMDIEAAKADGERMLPILQENDVGLIHNCTLMPAFSYAAKQLGIPQVSSIYQSERPETRPYVDRAFKPDIVHSDAVATANVWLEKLDVPVRCIRNYVPERYWLGRIPERKKKGFHIAIIGALQARKGQLEAVKAMALLPEQYDAELFIYGYDKFNPEYKKKCMESAKKSGVADRVHFMGFIDNVIESFEQDGIDIQLCSSMAESLPQSMLEAAAMGVPIVSTPVGSVPELLDSGAGFLSRGFTPENVAESMERCFKAFGNGTVRGAVEKARSLVLANCTAEIVSLRLFSVYAKAFAAIEKEKRSLLAPPAAASTAMTVDPSSSSAIRQRSLERDVMCYSRGITKKRVYRIFCDTNKISHLGIVFAHEQSACSGSVRVAVFYKGVRLRNVTMPFISLSYQTWTYFGFEPIYGCGGKTLDIEVSFEYDKDSGLIGVFEDSRRRNLAYRILKKFGLPRKRVNVLYFDCVE